MCSGSVLYWHGCEATELNDWLYPYDAFSSALPQHSMAPHLFPPGISMSERHDASRNPGKGAVAVVRAASRKCRIGSALPRPCFGDGSCTGPQPHPNFNALRIEETMKKNCSVAFEANAFDVKKGSNENRVKGKKRNGYLPEFSECRDLTPLGAKIPYPRSHDSGLSCGSRGGEVPFIYALRTKPPSRQAGSTGERQRDRDACTGRLPEPSLASC